MTTRSVRRPGVERLRFLLQLLVIVSCGGIGAELLLIGHFEDRFQWLPLVALGVGALASAAAILRPGRKRLRVMRWVMLLTVGVGIWGVLLHGQGNREFELEMVPGMQGFELARETLSGATPFLAPGALIQLGLLGAISTLIPPSEHG